MESGPWGVTIYAKRWRREFSPLNTASACGFYANTESTVWYQSWEQGKFTEFATRVYATIMRINLMHRHKRWIEVLIINQNSDFISRWIELGGIINFAVIWALIQPLLHFRLFVLLAALLFGFEFWWSQTYGGWPFQSWNVSFVPSCRQFQFQFPVLIYDRKQIIVVGQRQNNFRVFVDTFP